MDDPIRYPIGKFHWNPDEFPRCKEEWIATLADAPLKLRAVMRGLNEGQLDTPYREGGWTPRQVVHHLADAHMNAFIRCKLALTESTPPVKPWDENLWAELPDTKAAPVDLSVELLAHLHARWVLLLRSMKPEDFKREFNHPHYGKVSIAEALAHYAWHSRQHTAHIEGLRKRKGW